MACRWEEDSLVPAAVFRDFYRNHWPKDWYHDDSAIEVEDWHGNWLLADDAVVSLADLGSCVWQGRDGAPYREGEMFPISKVFAEWAASAPSDELLLIALPEAARPDLEAFLEDCDGRIVGPGRLGSGRSDPDPEAGLPRP